MTRRRRHRAKRFSLFLCKLEKPFQWEKMPSYQIDVAWTNATARDPDYIQMIPCDVTACREDSKRIELGSQRCIVNELIDFERVDRLGFGVRTSLESLFGVLSAVRASKLLDGKRC
ncbi:hypothetical protein AVEN_10410-1 [Araneus ventricosus]|uniref:Uncharacterized protein n=1 Tax=Araneus ventricosus TaxID=182803 RepID=A0A4Y2IYT2_ARAVE|nr:hypothetical protein AVEN_10410-1 [Araneus ventricosus]